MVIEIIVGTVSGVLVFLIATLIQLKLRKHDFKISKRKQAKQLQYAKIDALVEGNQALLGHHIAEVYYKNREKESITPETLESVYAMHKPYNRLKGNGRIDSMVKKLEQMPIK